MYVQDMCPIHTMHPSPARPSWFIPFLSPKRNQNIIILYYDCNDGSSMINNMYASV